MPDQSEAESPSGAPSAPAADTVANRVTSDVTNIESSFLRFGGSWRRAASDTRIPPSPLDDNIVVLPAPPNAAVALGAHQAQDHEWHYAGQAGAADRGAEEDRQ